MSAAPVERIDNFDPEAACRQVRAFHKTVLKRFLLPCTLPVFLACMGLAAWRPFAGSEAILLWLVPLAVVHTAWAFILVRQLGQERAHARDHLRLLKQHHPDLVPRATAVMRTVVSAVCVMFGILGTAGGTMIVAMAKQEPPSEADRLFFQLLLAFECVAGMGFLGQAVAFWKSKTAIGSVLWFMAWSVPAIAILISLMASSK